MYPNTFYRVSVKALIRDEHGKVLVVKENQDTWSLPVGGLDHGENPTKGLERELKEELGLEASTIKDVIAVRTFYLEKKSAWLLWIVYRVDIARKTISPGQGVADTQFIDATTLATSEDVFEQLVCEVATI